MKKGCRRLCALILGLAAAALPSCGQTSSGAYEQAMKALEDGNYILARQEFDQAKQQDDRLAEVARGEGILCLAQQQYEQAMELFEKAEEYAGKNNRAFVQDVKLYRAETFLALENRDEAEKICREILETGKDAKAELLLGRIALEKGELQKAEEHFASSVEQEQTFENYLVIYELYVSVSMEADGAAYLEQALALTPADASDYCSRGQICCYLGQTVQAKTSFARAVDLGNTDAVPMMGKLYLENGEVQAARSMYQSYLNEAVRPALAYNGLALCDLADQQYDDALANIARGLEENDAEVRESLLLNEIAAYEYKLDFAAAKAKMEAFLSEYPDNKEAVRENIFLQSR